MNTQHFDSVTRLPPGPEFDAAGRPLGRDSALERARAFIRLHSIDTLRGLVMVLMALDHVRDYFMGVRVNPLDVEHTSAMLFATRWITHFCAPVFVLLTGVSAYLTSRRCTKAELSRLLLTRGLWLILLEWTVVTFVWSFNFHYEIGLILQVMWAIGMSMVVLAALVHLPLWAIGLIGFALCYTHNLFDTVTPAQLGAWAPLWRVLHVQGPLMPIGYVHYPLIPWVGVMAIGYALGTLYELEPARRRRILVTLGLAALALFLALRATNFYGDPKPWSAHAELTRSVMSFLNVTKYPPSLLFLLITLGPALILLAALESARGWLARVLETFGNVPLFFYVLHIALAHLGAGLLAMAMGYGSGVLTHFFVSFPRDWGVGLAATYLAWLWVLVTLYPACRWYASLKRRSRAGWLLYL